MILGNPMSQVIRSSPDLFSLRCFWSGTYVLQSISFNLWLMFITLPLYLQACGHDIMRQCFTVINENVFNNAVGHEFNKTRASIHSCLLHT